LLKWAEQDTIDAGGAPAGGDDQTRDVPEMEGTRTGDEAPANGDAAALASGVEAAAVTEVDAPQRPKEAENLVASEGGVP
jgi:hypothetical protein